MPFCALSEARGMVIKFKRMIASGMIFFLTLAMLLSAIIGWFIAIYGHVDIVSKLYQMRAPAVSLITIIGPFAILGVGITEFVLAYQLAAVSRSQRVV